MADKDKSPAKPAKTQYQINKDMLDEMAGKPGIPVKPPKSTAKTKISKAQREDKSGDAENEVDAEPESKVAVKVATTGEVAPQGWDTYTQGKWKCNECDLEFRHFCPQLSAHMGQTKHNFSLIDVATGEQKASSLSEARSRGFISKTSKKKKRRVATNQTGTGINPPPAAQQKQSPPSPGDTQLTPEQPTLSDRVARFMADNPELTQWIEDNPGQRPPDDLLNKEPVGSPQIKSSIIVKYVRTTAEVTAALEVLYDLIVSNPLSIEKGYNPSLGEWMEDTIFEHYRAFAKHYKLESFFRKFLGGDNA